MSAPLPWDYCVGLFLSPRARSFLCDGSQRFGHGTENAIGSCLGAVADRQPHGLVVGQPGLALIVLPDQGFEGQIDANCPSCLHQRGTGPRVVENDHLGWRQCHPDFRSRFGVVDASKNSDVAICDRGYQPVDRLLGTIAAWVDRQSIRC